MNMNELPPLPAATARSAHDGLHQRIGQLTRSLHDSLRELGYDKDLMHAREDLPDARDRLSYIARLTGEAAEKVLDAVDEARSLQEDLSARAASLKKRWQLVAADAPGETLGDATPARRQLQRETLLFIDAVDRQAGETIGILTDIMMAQDFHDLTGQVIRRVLRTATDLEQQLVKLLLETTPPDGRNPAAPARAAPSLHGPAVRPAGRDDVVANQAGVDAVLASLGF